MRLEAFLSAILCGTINHTRREEIALRTHPALFMTHVFNTAVFQGHMVTGDGVSFRESDRMWTARRSHCLPE